MSNENGYCACQRPTPYCGGSGRAEPVSSGPYSYILNDLGVCGAGWPRVVNKQNWSIIYSC